MSDRGNEFAGVAWIAFDEGLERLLAEHKIVICGAGQWAQYLCPQCDKPVMVEMDAKQKPCWKMTNHPDNTVSFEPSVVHDQKLGGCGAHYFIERNKIKWV